MLNAQTSYAEATADLDENRRGLLTILALRGPLNVSTAKSHLARIGLRETRARAFSTTTLRPLLQDLIRRQLVTEDRDGFRCHTHVRYPSLRLAAADGTLEAYDRDLTLRCRPLGLDGPDLVPGRGAPSLLGSISGEPVQTDRDRAEELRLAEAAAAELDLVDLQSWSTVLPDPERCLESVRTRHVDSSSRVRCPPLARGA